MGLLKALITFQNNAIIWVKSLFYIC